MDDRVSDIDQQPAIFGPAFNPRRELKLLVGGLRDCFGQGSKHPVAGAVTNDKEIGKWGDFADVEQYNVFSFFIFEYIDQMACEFQSVQTSPRTSTNEFSVT